MIFDKNSVDSWFFFITEQYSGPLLVEIYLIITELKAIGLHEEQKN